MNARIRIIFEDLDNDWIELIIENKYNNWIIED